jgi:hypothetical protein
MYPAKIRGNLFRLENLVLRASPEHKEQSVKIQGALALTVFRFAQKIQEYWSEPETIVHIWGHGDKGVLSQASNLLGELE